MPIQTGRLSQPSCWTGGNVISFCLKPPSRYFVAMLKESSTDLSERTATRSLTQRSRSLCDTVSLTIASLDGPSLGYLVPTRNWDDTEQISPSQDSGLPSESK